MSSRKGANFTLTNAKLYAEDFFTFYSVFIFSPNTLTNEFDFTLVLVYRESMIIDTEVFPYTNEYDINLWFDEGNGKLRIIAYELDWEADPDNEGEYSLCLTGYDNPIEIATIDELDLKMWDFFVSDHWTTRTAFEGEFAHLPMFLHIVLPELEKLPKYEAFLS
jgi:hypothetical protein